MSTILFIATTYVICSIVVAVIFKLILRFGREAEEKSLKEGMSSLDEDDKDYLESLLAIRSVGIPYMEKLLYGFAPFFLLVMVIATINEKLKNIGVKTPSN